MIKQPTQLKDSLHTPHFMEVEIFMREVKGYDEKDIYMPNKLAVLFLANRYSEFESFAKTKEYINTNIVGESVKERLLNILEKFHVTIERLRNRYKRKELQQGILEWDVSTNWHYSRDNFHKLILGLLNLQDNEIFLNQNADDYKLAAKVAAEYEKVSVYGIEFSPDAEYVGKIRSAVIDNKINVITEDALKKDFSDLQADKIFCGLQTGFLDERPFANDKLEKFFENTLGRVCREWAYTISAMLNQKPGGRTIAVVTNPNLTNERDKSIRRKLIEAGKIEGIISLPERIGNIIILSDNNTSVKMLDVSEVTSRNLNEMDVEKILDCYTSSSGENFIVVTNDMISTKNYILNPSHYLIDKKITFDKFNRIIDYAQSIRRGAQQLRFDELREIKSDIPTDYQYLTAQDITEYGLIENLPYIKYIDKKYQKDILQEGDIIISKFAPFKVAVVPKTECKIIASGNLYIIKTYEGKNPYYLALFLKSKAGMMQLNAFSSGNNVKIITQRDLECIKIPYVSAEEQNSLVEEYLSLTAELKSIGNRREELINKIEMLFA